MTSRIGALLLRYLYLYKRSAARLMGILFWPVMDLLVWGFLTSYLEKLAAPSAVVYLLGAVVFWDIFYSAQQAITLSITEEIWARNILNIFVAPVRTWELLVATSLIGVFRATVSAGILAILARLFYGFPLFAIGLPLVPFYFSLLLFGWAMGIFTMALVLRFGQAAEALIWGIPFLIQPVSAVFYPLAVLPPWLQAIAKALPSTHVFEGMRAALQTGRVDTGTLVAAVGLNAVYLAAAAAFFGWMLGRVREKGYLSRLGME
ncbi:MAG: ABC transporter permease [Acidobacteriota bacterium]|nr:ABC transporter permease [Acidobacteriota bacterium]